MSEQEVQELSQDGQAQWGEYQAALMYPVDGDSGSSSTASQRAAERGQFWIPSSLTSSSEASACVEGGGHTAGAGGTSYGSSCPSFSVRHPSDGSEETNCSNGQQDDGQSSVCDLDLLARVPRNGDGTLTSAGSINHASGNCSPCVYWFKDACKRGVNCKQCHFRHEGQKAQRLRSSKSMRQKLRMRDVQPPPQAGKPGQPTADAGADARPPNMPGVTMECGAASQSPLNAAMAALAVTTETTKMKL